MGFIAHYLDIDWQAADLTSRVEVSTFPIEFETTPDDTLHAEISIFRDFAPWVGLHLSDELADVVPYTVTVENVRVPWLKVFDNDKRTWWIPSTGWSETSNKHVSEMHRSIGLFLVELGLRRRLIFNAIALELNRANVQEYLDDFTDELVWLALGHANGSSGQVACHNTRDLLDALKAFTDAASRILEKPAHEISEVTGDKPTAQVRPNSATFRALMRRPSSRNYPSRIAQESADIAENRYVRSLVSHCRRLAASLARSFAHQQALSIAGAAREKTRADELQAKESVEVDPEIFDNQLSGMRTGLKAIGSWTGATLAPAKSDRIYRFTIGAEFLLDKTTSKGFLYRNPDRDHEYDKLKDIKFSVAELPGDLHELVIAASRFDRDLSLELTGKAIVSTFRTSTGKLGRRAAFTHISGVTPNSPVLISRENARSQFEENGWQRPLDRKEQEECRSEAKVANNRAVHFLELSGLNEKASSELNILVNSLDRQDMNWNQRGVGTSSQFPLGMRFFQVPIYAAVLAAYHKVCDLENRKGLSGETLDKLGRINALHASALYERWCLIKILGVLMQDFRFEPQGEWLQQIVSMSQSGSTDLRGLSIVLSRENPCMTAHLDVEPVLANRRRPDFRLRFSNGGSTGAMAPKAGLVMDAKFRTRWKPDELASTLRLLVEAKRYGQDGDRVFILQPSRGAISHRTSPLTWGRDCDYGQQHGHSHGSIHLAAGKLSGEASASHLRRLIGLQLQQVFPEPVLQRGSNQEGDRTTEALANISGSRQSSSSFCIVCGKCHEPSDISSDTTKSGNLKWHYSCSQCESRSLQTHCYSCRSPLHKNGLEMTYHLTVADQISNIVCYKCGAGF